MVHWSRRACRRLPEPTASTMSAVPQLRTEQADAGDEPASRAIREVLRRADVSGPRPRRNSRGDVAFYSSSQARRGRSRRSPPRSRREQSFVAGATPSFTRPSASTRTRRSVRRPASPDPSRRPRRLAMRVIPCSPLSPGAPDRRTTSPGRRWPHSGVGAAAFGRTMNAVRPNSAVARLLPCVVSLQIKRRPEPSPCNGGTHRASQPYRPCGRRGVAIV